MSAWRISGTYLESCNCEAICPCRRINGVPGGRSTHGICEGALSWQIVEGQASPWTWMLYVDERADPDQQRAIEEIWTGRVKGEQLEQFPWAWKASNLLAVRPAQIEIDHTPRRQWFQVRDAVSVRISGPVRDDATVTCVIPGHHQPGEEVIAEELKVDEGPLRFEHQGKCGYAAVFDYRST